MKDYKNIEHMRNLNDSLIWERMKRCYDYGYEDGQKEKPQAIYEMKVEEYNKGLNEAWECARTIIGLGESEELLEDTNFRNFICKYSASEAIEKVKAYQKRKIYCNHTTEEISESFIKDVSAVKDQLPEHNCEDCKKTKDPIFYGHCVGECDYAKQTEDEIKVGYEVYNLDPENKRIVTAIDGDKAIQLCSNGKYTVDNIDTLHWTGREDLRIKKVLEKITNEI